MNDEGDFDWFAKRTESSNKKLAENFDVHVLGPYAGLCSHILEEITKELRSDGYSTHTCAEIDDPPFPANIDRSQKNWKRSVNCLKKANAAVFVFLESKSNRFFHSGTKPQELNSSVCAELIYWATTLDRSGDKTFVVFEGDMRNTLGSLIDGVTDECEFESIDVQSEDYPEMFEQIEAQCWTWMNRFIRF